MDGWTDGWMNGWREEIVSDTKPFFVSPRSPLPLYAGIQEWTVLAATKCIYSAALVNDDDIEHARSTGPQLPMQ